MLLMMGGGGSRGDGQKSRKRRVNNNNKTSSTIMTSSSRRRRILGVISLAFIAALWMYQQLRMPFFSSYYYQTLFSSETAAATSAGTLSSATTTKTEKHTIIHGEGPPIYCRRDDDDDSNNNKRNKNATSSSSSCCQGQTMQPWTVTKDLGQFQHYSEFMEVIHPKDLDNQLNHHHDNDQEALCYFDGARGLDRHFPHAMEQLYQCWSFFRAHAGQPRVLLFPSELGQTSSSQQQQHSYQPRLEKVYLEQQKRHGRRKHASSSLKRIWQRIRGKSSPQTPFVHFLDGFLRVLVTDLNVTLRPVLPWNETTTNTTTKSRHLGGSHHPDSAFVKTKRGQAYVLAQNDASALVQAVVKNGGTYQKHQKRTMEQRWYSSSSPSWSNHDVLHHLTTKYHSNLLSMNQQGHHGHHRQPWTAKFLGPRNRDDKDDPTTKPKCRCGDGNPTISILDRKGSRQMLNIDAVVQGLEQSLRATAAGDGRQNKDPPPRIHVFYFEGVSFLDQVAYFANVDILISPHGAQLTGLPFMASASCRAVLELFPVGYCLPWYFGSLALRSGLNHSYLALQQQQKEEGARNASACYVAGSHRGAARRVKICPNVTPIVEAVQNMVTQWRQCCCGAG